MKNKQKVAWRMAFNKHLKDEKTANEEGERLKKEWEEEKEKRIKLMEMGVELGNKDNGWHLQGYIEFNRLVDIGAFKKRYGLSYVEKAKEDRETNVKYTFKQKRKHFSFSNNEEREREKKFKKKMLAETNCY